MVIFGGIYDIFATSFGILLLEPFISMCIYVFLVVFFGDILCCLGILHHQFDFGLIFNSVLSALFYLYLPSTRFRIIQLHYLDSLQNYTTVVVPFLMLSLWGIFHLCLYTLVWNNYVGGCTFSSLPFGLKVTF